MFPESYSAPAGWYGGKYPVKMETAIPEFVLVELKVFYTEILKPLPDVLTAADVSRLTSYGKTSINNWCKKGLLKSFQRGQMNYIPKIYLVELFCSTYFCTIIRKSDWRSKTLKRFSRWQKQHVAKGEGSFIEDLFFGNIDPQRRGYTKDSHIVKVSDSISVLFSISSSFFLTFSIMPTTNLRKGSCSLKAVSSSEFPWAISLSF